MSFSDIIDNITKAYYTNDSSIKDLMNSDAIKKIVNSNHFDIIYKKHYIEALIKNTGMSVADMLIDGTHDEKSKEFVINYCIAMLFKYNKYESAMMMTFKYEKYNIAYVFNYMQCSNTDINILKGIFSKYYDELNTEDNRIWLMNKIGMYNNIELLNHVEQYYEIDDIDIMNILNGAINKKNHYYLNTIKYIFNNYEFAYDVNFMFNFIREMNYLEYDDAIHYVMTQLVEKNGNGYIDILLNHPNMDNYFQYDFINNFIKVFKNYLLPTQLKNIIYNLPMTVLSNGKLFTQIINNFNYISDNDKIQLENLRLNYLNLQCE